MENLQRQDEATFDRCLAAFFQEPCIDTVGVRFNFPAVPTANQTRLYERITALRTQSGKRVVVFSRASEPLASEWYALFQKLDLPFVQEYRKALRALQRLRQNESDRAKDRFLPPQRVDLPSISRLEYPINPSYSLSAKLLSDYGISLAPWRMADSGDDAARASEALGYPCVLKVASPDVPHKTEYGALALGLNSAEEVRAAYSSLLARVREKKPDAYVEGVIVQPQLRGVECLLGITRDPQLGPVLAVGLGGVWVEVLKDVSVRIPPITTAEARRALGALRGRSILDGVRGAPPADIEALAEMASRLSWLAHDLRDDIEELDLNPVVVLPAGQGALAIDALIVTRSHERPSQ